MQTIFRRITRDLREAKLPWDREPRGSLVECANAQREMEKRK
jgi:hypothetical protein